MLTAPDCSKLGEIFRKTPQSQFWRDPAMKPFRDKLLTKCDEEITKPLERDLDLKIANYTALLQGQLTFALTQDGWQGDDDQEPGMLLLLDVRDKAGLLKTNLTALRKKWVDAGKPLRTERIRDAEFTILPISSNDVPKSLRSLLPGSPPVQKPDQEESADRPPAKDELVIGMVDSLLIVGDAIKPVEKVVTRLTGGSVPALAENAAYQANYATCFRDVPLYGWVNVKAFMDIWLRQMAKEKENSQASPPLDLKLEKVINALGFGGLKTLAFSFQEANEGGLFQVFLGVPESARQGLFKIIAGEAKECTPPPFVPADVIKFQRWRIDGKKAWATLEKTLSDISPQAASTLNFLLDSANTYAKDKEPGFDIRKNLIGNLGDDIISYEKASRSGSAAELTSRPSLLLIGSTDPDQLAASLKSIFVYLTQQPGSPPEEREFLGRKIYTITLGPTFLRLGGGASPPSPVTLKYVAGAGYVALSTDVSMIEDYLRSSQSQAKSLRETPGLTDAAQRVISPGSSLFGYQNQAESMRAT